MKKYVAGIVQAAKERFSGAEQQAMPTSIAQSSSDLQAIIYQGMRQFTPRFHIRYTGPTDRLGDEVMAAMKRAIQKDDYIAGTIQQHGYSYEGVEGDVVITIELTYNTDAQKERFV